MENFSSSSGYVSAVEYYLTAAAGIVSPFCAANLASQVLPFSVTAYPFKQVLSLSIHRISVKKLVQISTSGLLPSKASTIWGGNLPCATCSRTYVACPRAINFAALSVPVCTIFVMSVTFVITKEMAPNACWVMRCLNHKLFFTA